MGIERLVDGSIGPAFALAERGRIVALNDAAARLFGRPAAELVGERCCDVVAACDASGERVCRPDGCATLSALASGHATELPWCTWPAADGSAVPITATAIAVPRDARSDATIAVVLLHRQAPRGGTVAGRDVAADTSARRPARSVLVRLFGRPECSSDGEVLAVPRRRLFELLALLAFAGSAGLRRDQLCELIWPDAPLGRGRSHLRVLLHSARQSVGSDVIEEADSGERARLRLAPAVWVDATAFECEARTLLKEATASVSGGPDRLEQLETVLSMYTGDLDECGQFGEWVFPHRERLRSLHVELLAEATRLASRAGDAQRAMEYCRRGAASDPLDEAFQIALIGAYGQLGRPREAIAQYQLYRRALASDLALRPSPAVERALQRAVGGTEA